MECHQCMTLTWEDRKEQIRKKEKMEKNLTWSHWPKFRHMRPDVVSTANGRFGVLLQRVSTAKIFRAVLYKWMVAGRISAAATK